MFVFFSLPVEMLCVAVAFIGVMAGMLAAAPELGRGRKRMSRKKPALGLDPRVGTGFPIRTCAKRRNPERIPMDRIGMRSGVCRHAALAAGMAVCASVFCQAGSVQRVAYQRLISP
jgi:hypothetical protein